MDNSYNRALRDLGISYCTVYLISLVAGSLAFWLYWDRWRMDSLIADLADLATVSAGAALLAIIVKEGMWFMVLAAMKIKEWKEEGRKEGLEVGLEVGREEGRENQREREAEAYAKFGVEVNGVLMLPQTPEVQRFLAGEDKPEAEQ